MEMALSLRVGSRLQTVKRNTIAVTNTNRIKFLIKSRNRLIGKVLIQKEKTRFVLLLNGSDVKVIRTKTVENIVIFTFFLERSEEIELISKEMELYIESYKHQQIFTKGFC